MVDRSNPYDPSLAVPDQAPRKLRWLRAFLTLNMILIGIPLAMALMGAVEMYLQWYSEVATNNGDPVTFQHVYFDVVDFSVLPILLFVGLPNALLALWYLGPIILAFRRKASLRES